MSCQRCDCVDEENAQLRAEKDALVLQIEEMKKTSHTFSVVVGKQLEEKDRQTRELQSKYDKLLEMAQPVARNRNEIVRLNDEYKRAIDNLKIFSCGCHQHILQDLEKRKCDCLCHSVNRGDDVSCGSCSVSHLKRNHDHARGVCDEKTCAECKRVEPQQKKLCGTWVPELGPCVAEVPCKVHG